MSPLGRLIADPRRFSFDAAVRLLTSRRSASDRVRFRAAAGVAFAAAEIVDVQTSPDAASITTTLIGLTGPSGTLPIHITDAVVTAGRRRSPSLAAFLDMLSERMVAAFGAAGIKYRPHRDADRPVAAVPIADALLALTGQLTAGIVERLPTGPEPFRHYAGLFAARPRSAERLQALASDFLGRPVEVLQFAGAWLAIPDDEQTRLPVGLAPGRYYRLGEDAAIGVRAWDQQARIVLRIGPLDAKSFASLLPDRPALSRLMSLVRAYLGFETGFAINLVHERGDIPPLTLTQGSALDPLGASRASTPSGVTPPDPHDDHPRLGWNTWLPTSAGPAVLGDADEPLFEAA